MNTNQHLAQLLGMPQPDFDHYLESVNQIALLRERAAPSAAQAAENRGAPRPPARAATPPDAVVRLANRPPMRAPKPGTLRAAIHDVLRSSGKPVRRAEIIASASRRLGREIDAKLRAKAGDVLANPHDPFICRVGYGTYRMAQDKGDGAASPALK